MKCQSFPIGVKVWQSLPVTNPFDSITEWLTIPDVAERLQIPLGKVRRLVEEHNLITVRINGVQQVPAHLIMEDGETLPSLRGTVVVLLDSGLTLDAAVEWLYTPHESLESTPMNSLLKGRKSEVRRAAQVLLL